MAAGRRWMDFTIMGDSNDIWLLGFLLSVLWVIGGCTGSGSDHINHPNKPNVVILLTDDQFKRKLALIITLLLAFNSIFHSVTLAQPNVVIILADDMGYGDVGSYNSDSKIPTPNMDRLANLGMRFTDAHSPSSVCTPSRYGILTGRYAWRTALKRGVFNNFERPLIETDRPTIASMLKKEGYRTACIGKWHLGLGWSVNEGQEFDFSKPWPWPGGTMPREEESKIDFTKPFFGGPVELGFDNFFGSSACPTCNTPYCYVEQDRVVDEPNMYYEGKYLEQDDGYRSSNWEEDEVDPVFTRKGVDFINQAAEDSEPFFLYLSSSTPHEPCEEEVVPEFMRGASKAGARGDMVALFDWMVGQIIETLQENGLFENTLLIVTSDNGAKPGDYNRYTYGHKSCGNLRGFKGGIWEGGHRVPLIVSWPQAIPAGRISNQLIGLQDVMATVAQATDIPLPSNAAEDSQSFYPELTGKSNERARKDLINHSAMGVFAIRQENWKLIIESDGSGDSGRGVHNNGGTPPDPSSKGQLYNLHDDPFESYNLIDKEPKKAQELRNLLTKYQSQDTPKRPK